MNSSNAPNFSAPPGLRPGPTARRLALAFLCVAAVARAEAPAPATVIAAEAVVNAAALPVAAPPAVSASAPAVLPPVEMGEVEGPLTEELVGPPAPPPPSPPPPQGVGIPGAETCEVPKEPLIPVPDRPEVNAEIAAFSGRHRKVIARGLERAGRYLPMIRKVFSEAGLPPELASLPLVESSFVVNALSRAGALGMWQFIASTARASQLRVDWWVDERLDPEASTRAAARHLKELYDQFGDWELALAAYNAGAGGVGRAMTRSGKGDFWGLMQAKRLHSETRRYVPKFYAALEILLDPTEYGFNPIDENGAEMYDVVNVTCQTDLYTVSKATGIPLADLKDLNPSLIRCVTPPSSAEFPLRVPVGWGEQVRQVLETLDPADRYQYKKHKVASGDTLASVARRYGIGAELLAELNRLPAGKALKRGKELLIPYKRPSKTQGPAAARADLHVVEKGDTAWNIASRNGISLKELLRWNGLKEGDVLSLGRELRVAPPEAERPAAKAPDKGQAEAQDKTQANAGEPAKGKAEAGSGEGEMKTYVVRPGDTLWSIARANGLTVDALRRLNRLGAKAPLAAGDLLRLR